MTTVTEEELTIDELARRTGMTVRNIRAHQSRGLLPPPDVRGRIGFYGAEHVARIELIKEMQADGFNLGAISKLLESAVGSTGELLRFTRAVKQPFEEEETAIIGLDEMIERWKTVDVAVLARAEKQGLLRPIGDGRYEEISPRLMRASDELMTLGVPVDKQLDLLERLRRHADAIAVDCVKLFLDAVWRPFEQSGAPEEGLSEVSAAVERLRPIASEALLSIFQLAMTEHVEQEFGRTVERLRRKQRTR